MNFVLQRQDLRLSCRLLQMRGTAEEKDLSPLSVETWTYYFVVFFVVFKSWCSCREILPVVFWRMLRRSMDCTGLKNWPKASIPFRFRYFLLGPSLTETKPNTIHKLHTQTVGLWLWWNVFPFKRRSCFWDIAQKLWSKYHHAGSIIPNRNTNSEKCYWQSQFSDSKFVAWKLTSFSKTTLLQNEMLLKMLYTIESCCRILTKRSYCHWWVITKRKPSL